MKILYLMSGFPYPPTGGGPLRIMGLIQGAAAAGHEVHTLSFGLPSSDLDYLKTFCGRVDVVAPPTRAKVDRLKTLLFSNRADMERRSWSEDFVAKLTEILAQTQFDIVQLQSLEMGVYVAYVRRLQPTAKRIYDAYNAEAELQRSVFHNDRRILKRWPQAIYSGVQWRRLVAFEKSLCQAVDGVLAVSDADAKLLSQVSGTTPVWVVNNGIDVADYATQPDLDLNLQQPSLIFTGIMDYRPNVDAALWFADDILPHIPDAHLYLVGNRPNAAVQALDDRPNITVTGFVEQVMPYLHYGTVFVVPLRTGSGTRLKLLQALAAGCAIVSTRIGAMGLNAEHGREMLLADDARSFADAVSALLADAAKRKELATTGRQFVVANFDWSVIVPRLLAAYQKVTES